MMIDTYLDLVLLELVATASNHLLHSALVYVLTYHLEVRQVVLVDMLLDKPCHLISNKVSDFDS